MTNPWLAHVRKTMREHPGNSFTQILKRANRTYKKGGNNKNKKKKKNKKVKTRKTKRKKNKGKKKK
tara:strand:+ start:189 stop:386 length:198 start_codon:yes stop_codon:yes gene_type:complete